MTAISASRTRLRPGAAVYPVDEGLLFCGWQSSALITCGAGVSRIWAAVEPRLRAGAELEELREQLPERARPAWQGLLDALVEHQMLAEHSDDPGPDFEYLACFAPDPDAAATAAMRSTIALIGPDQLTEATAAMLTSCGLTVRPAGAGAAETDQVRVYLGDPVGLAATGPVEVAAVTAGPAILVGDCTAGAQRLLQAASAQVMSAQPAQSVPAISWLLAHTVVVERVHRALAGLSDPGLASMISGRTARTVRLAPLARPVARTDWATVSTLAPAEPSAIEELGGQLTGPLPGGLVQVPLARQQVELTGPRAGRYVGVGPDQRQAGVDALLAAARARLQPVLDPDSSFTVAGQGGQAVLAEAVGRCLVALAEPSDLAFGSDESTLADPMVRRWLACAQRLATEQLAGRPGAVELVTAASRHCPAIVLARAGVAGTASWGFGTDPAQAGEHALRGLLALLLDDTAARQPIDRTEQARAAVVGAASQAEAEALLRAVLTGGPDTTGGPGSQPELPELPELAARVSRQVPGLHCQPWDLGGEFESRGIVGATVTVSR